MVPNGCISSQMCRTTFQRQYPNCGRPALVEAEKWCATVGALLELLLTKGTTARGSFPSEAAVINAIRERHPKTPGLS
jgi:hypothetical protein